MSSRVLSLALVLALASCGGADENPVSKSTDPLVDFGIEPPDVVTGWPCPPFEGVVTTQDMVGDSDGDTITDCQEEELGSDRNSDDSDGDGVPDLIELGGDPLEALDTDLDGILDLNDLDDDGDLVPTAEEIEGGDFRDDDNDGDGKLDFVDADDDNDLLPGAMEDWDLDGDPRNDDTDDDGIADWRDNDDDGDTVLTRNEDPDGNRTPSNDDTDFDGEIDCHDADDDMDGVPTADEDADGDGNPASDDLDQDGIPDFRDADEDGDGVPTVAFPNDPYFDPTRTEDRNGNGVADDDTDADGTPDYRDNDDDGDLVTAEDVDADGDPLNDDTDGDTIPNLLDADDDGDGCPTFGEDLDGDGDPTNDGISKTDSVPNYLDDSATTCTVVLTPTYDLTVTGSALPAPVEGDTVIAALFEDGGAQIGGNQTATITGNAFSLVFPDAIEAGPTYHVDLFVDSDASGTCAAESSFRIQSISTSGQDETAALTIPGDVSPQACATFP